MAPASSPTIGIHAGGAGHPAAPSTPTPVRRWTSNYPFIAPPAPRVHTATSESPHPKPRAKKIAKIPTQPPPPSAGTMPAKPAEGKSPPPPAPPPIAEPPSDSE
ncbi:MAG: hypothetical protein HY543_06715 [Deltaproteobacteria bacterium]|nr:hypothetical protein [Deltaproteobacteria bacterium]